MIDSLVYVLDNRGSCAYNGYFVSESETIDRLMVVAEKCRV
jgi:hypothetical protein